MSAASKENQLRLPSANGSGSFQNLPDIASLCPYNKFCRSSPIKEITRTDQEPCCEKCSCDYDCLEIGSCCPDMPLAGFVKPKYPCIPLSHFGKDAVVLYDRTSYHVITDCLDMVKAIAYPKCFQPSEVQDFVIVSDPRNGRVYRNKHCAECNDVQNYVNWKLRVQCPDMSQLGYVENDKDREKYLMENCSLLPLPLEARSADMSRCVQDSDVISTCNVTGNWDQYDRGIEEACMKTREDQNALFTNYIVDIGIYKYFASVYCYICNVAKHLKKIDVCEIDNDKKYRSGSVSSLSAILVTKMWEDNTAISNSRCKSTDIWDQYRKICRPLICPFGKYPVHGRCKDTFSNLEGYTVAIHFEVIFLVGSMAANRDLLHVLESRFFRELGTELTCGRCYSALLIENDPSSTIFLRLEIFSTDTCSYDTMLKRIQKIAFKKKMYLKFKHEGQQFRVEMRLIFKEIFRNDVYDSPAEKNYVFCIRVNIIDSSIFQYCPRIKLTKDEANNLGIFNVSENSLTDSSPASDTNLEIQEVCVDTYFIANKARSGAISAYPCDICDTKVMWFQFLSVLIGYVSVIL
ncbi:uncharacterized protein LOC123555935 [Mercenaria mercenaria]|uniref:uncharacterized protein LOC123555935 n=1 Tax=Mercenaria mercenaria TaxID=6596 RepID=UPI00234ECE38|nr:uncharacterized protein LOC123555935 [Mercenaria mercenaria]